MVEVSVLPPALPPLLKSFSCAWCSLEGRFPGDSVSLLQEWEMLLPVCCVSVCSVVNQGCSSGVKWRLLELMILQPVADLILILHR